MLAAGTLAAGTLAAGTLAVGDPDVRVSPTAADPDVHVSAGAAGRVVVVFGGLAGSGLAHSALLAASLAALRTLELLGVRPDAAVGYSLGEITGLAWADCLPAAEAARLAAQCGQVLRGCALPPRRDGPHRRRRRDRPRLLRARPPARRRLRGTPDARAGGVHARASASLTRRAAALGIAVDVLRIMHALHCPAMARCTAPLRSVFAGTRFAPPRRRLMSTSPAAGHARR